MKQQAVIITADPKQIEQVMKILNGGSNEPVQFNVLVPEIVKNEIKQMASERKVMTGDIVAEAWNVYKQLH